MGTVTYVDVVLVEKCDCNLKFGIGNDNVKPAHNTILVIIFFLYKSDFCNFCLYR